MQTRANENARHSVLTSWHSELPSEDPSCTQKEQISIYFLGTSHLRKVYYCARDGAQRGPYFCASEFFQKFGTQF
ncbi:hypothetical protein Y032_0012g1602 [Ancylostoma ceylanicum]|uniref:Uncharacterized protein n=1 Tax=Ancylostoma ceylanicum TaxID=53326 RepID=A0A016VC02_9BILA|nr:hypothetical protein Y032_0012g1602 [Ancylostoma ceylanicum]